MYIGQPSLGWVVQGSTISDNFKFSFVTFPKPKSTPMEPFCLFPNLKLNLKLSLKINPRNLFVLFPKLELTPRNLFPRFPKQETFCHFSSSKTNPKELFCPLPKPKTNPKERFSPFPKPKTNSNSFQYNNISNFLLRLGDISPFQDSFRTAFTFFSMQMVTKIVGKYRADPDVIRTRSLLIWSQTRYHCATESTCQIRWLFMGSY